MATGDMASYGEFLYQRGDRATRLYYVRYPVPADLQKQFGTRIVRSLGTSNLAEARRKSRLVTLEIDAMFDAARAGAMTAADIEQEAQALYVARLAEYGAQPDTFYQDGDGTPSDADGALMALQDMLGNEDEGPAPDHGMGTEVDAILRRRGLTVSPAQRAELVKALHNAEMLALQNAITVRSGRIPERPAVLNPKAIDPVSFQVMAPTRPAPRKGKAPKISEAAKAYIAEHTRIADPKRPNKVWAPKTVMNTELTVKRFTEHTGDAPMDSVTGEDAAAFLERMARLSKQYARDPKARKMSFAELEKHYTAKDGDTLLSNTTLNKHATVMVGLFKWARKPYGLTGENPFSGLQRQKTKGTGWLPYSVDELNLLLGGKRFDASRDERVKPKKHGIPSSLPWLILISLYSGMRAAEIAGLRTSDIRIEDGVAFFAVEPHELRRVKSEAGERKVPVHSQLVALGFLDYVEHVRRQGHAMLFPGFKKNKKRDSISHTFSNRFTEYRRDVGITEERRTFHSLRDNFIECLDRAEVHQADVAAVVGHYRGFTFDVYSKRGPGMKRLQEIVEKVRYDGLKLDRLKR